MSADGEREFDRQLSEHLAATLNPQLGRAGRAFEEVIRQDRRRQLNHRRWFAVASSASLIAASVALALALWRPAIGPSLPGAGNRVAENVRPAAEVNEPRDVEQLVAWQTIDEGVENISLKGPQPGQPDKPLPVHRLRQDAIEQYEWTDPSDHSPVRLLVPRQDVLLIAQETY